MPEQQSNRIDPGEHRIRPIIIKESLDFTLDGQSYELTIGFEASTNKPLRHKQEEGDQAQFLVHIQATEEGPESFRLVVTDPSSEEHVSVELDPVTHSKIILNKTVLSGRKLPASIITNHNE